MAQERPRRLLPSRRPTLSGPAACPRGAANGRPATAQCSEPRAFDAQHALGRRPQPWRRDRAAAAVTEPVAAVGQLRQRAGDPRLRRLEAAADGDVGQAADGFGRPVADPLAEAQLGAPLRGPRQRGEALPSAASRARSSRSTASQVERGADA